jgi:hypothetical protein
MRAGAVALALLASLGVAAPAAAAPDDAADYVNTLRYARLVDRLRTSFDRWDALVASYPELGDRMIYRQGFLYGYQLDLAPNQVSVGFAYGKKHLRYYGVLHSTNVTFQDEHQFHRVALGVSANLGVAQLQADVGYGTAGLFYFAKLASAPLRSSLTVAFYPFREAADGTVTRETTTGKALPNIIRADFYGIPFAILGAEYNVLLGFARPELRLKLSSLFSYEELKTLPFDLELRLANNMRKLTDVSDLTTVLTAYYVTKLDFGVNAKLSLVNRLMFFGSVSYRTGDTLGDRLRAEGVTFADQRGVGFEGGLGLRVFGLSEHGFPADDYVKASVYYNFPDYQDILPQGRWGARLSVNY